MDTHESATAAPSESRAVADVIIAHDKLGDLSIDKVLPDALRSIRVHLGMEVAFVSEFADGRRRFLYVDSSLEKPPIEVGDSDPVDESFCQRVVDGRLPELIQNAAHIPAALELPVTTKLPVGAHLSVPIRLSSGRVYGTFCCFSTSPDPTLTDRDLAMMRVFADFAAKQIDRWIESDAAKQEMRARVRSMLEQKSFHIVYQPVFHLEQDRIVSFEALTRFSATPARTPDVWFSEAVECGLSEKLEMMVIEKALLGLDRLPQDVHLSLNVSPTNILNGAIARVLMRTPLDRIALEVTEHVAIGDYSKFGAALEPMRSQGLQLAVDDAGAGYASFRHILQLAPDIVKLDISLTRDIDTDRKRRALAAALISFAKETGIRIIAEGVETESELRALRQLQVNKAQGFLLGRPMPIDAACGLFSTSAR